ncbi:MAG: lasso peptide biosynthesis B2 protein [Gemmatimonadota bacterium]
MPWGRRITGITARELGMLTEAQVVLLACQVARWLRPRGKLIEWSGRAVARVPAGLDAAGASTVSLVCWSVTRAARYGVFRPQCLVRALALQRMLRRRGIMESSLHIGVRRQDGVFQAHAWVELNGAVLGDTRQHVRTFTRVSDLRLVEL